MATSSTCVSSSPLFDGLPISGSAFTPQFNLIILIAVGGVFLLLMVLLLYLLVDFVRSRKYTGPNTKLREDRAYELVHINLQQPRVDDGGGLKPGGNLVSLAVGASAQETSLRADLAAGRVPSLKGLLLPPPRDAPLLPPPGWRNWGVELYMDHFGFESLAKRSADQWDKIPVRSAVSRARLAINQSGLTSALSLQAALHGQRPTHAAGAAAIGTATISPDARIPANAFFEAGRVFDIRLRHGNLLLHDDMGSDVRGCALKFANSDDESPLDLLLNSGYVNPFWSVPTFWQFAKAQAPFDAEGILRWFHDYPAAYVNTIETHRRAPSSYNDIHYCTYAPLEFIAADGVKRWVKFRVIPGAGDGSLDSGLLTPQEQTSAHVWARHESEKRSVTYLREEFTQRVTHGKARYRLQLQLHVAQPSDSVEILNSARPWPADTHPWLHVAAILLTAPLEVSLAERTVFHVDRLPPSTIAVIPADSPEDYNSLNVVRSHIYPVTQRVRAQLARPDPLVRSPCKYTVRLTRNAGLKHSFGDMHIIFTGDHGTSHEIVVGNSPFDDVEFAVELDFLGRVCACEMWFPNCPLDQLRGWYVGVVVLTCVSDIGSAFSKGCTAAAMHSRAKPFHFAVHSPVGRSRIVVVESTTSIRQHDRLPLRVQFRRLEVLRYRQQLTYSSPSPYVRPARPFLPNHLSVTRAEDVMPYLQFENPRDRDFYSLVRQGYINMQLGHLLQLTNCWDSISDFDTVYPIKKIPAIHKTWKQDSVFADQFLNGMNPAIIQRCDKIPANFAVTNEMVARWLPKGSTLKSECERGAIYIVDYVLLDKAPHIANCHLCAPLVLLRVDSEGVLLPLAIQLEQTPSPSNPVWLPNDSPVDWLMAKMYVRNADFNSHQFRSHLGYAHFVSEAFILPMFHQIPSVHPVHKLLLPHAKFVFAINTLGRATLLGPTGLAEDTTSAGDKGAVYLLGKSNETWSYADIVFPKQLEKRGVTSTTSLPQYYYRDDGLALWHTMSTFVRRMLTLHYGGVEVSSSAVTADIEVQAWIEEVRHASFFSEEKGIPHILTSLDQLVELVTAVMFNLSAGHASVNFGQYDFFGYIPNTPGKMHLPPPTRKGEMTMELLVRSMPTRKETAQQVTLMDTLQTFSDSETFLGDYRDALFFEEEALLIIAAFQDDLALVSSSIRARNSNVDNPYKYLLPERVPNALAQ